MTVTDDVQKSAQAPRLRIDRLDAALRAAGLTKTDLRLRAQLSEKYLAKMRVHRNPESAYLARIADAVGVSTDWLLGRSPDPGRAISGQFRDWIVEAAAATAYDVCREVTPTLTPAEFGRLLTAVCRGLSDANTASDLDATSLRRAVLSSVAMLRNS